MLKQTKDYWKKRAEDEYEYKKTEEANWEKLQADQNQWRKRLEESTWLLQGVAEARKEREEVHTYADSTFDDALEDRSRKMKVFGLQGTDTKELEQFTDPNAAKRRSASKEKKKRGQSPSKNVNWGQSIASALPSSPFKFTTSREKTPEEVAREERARRQLESDERRAREKVLSENVERIKVLENVQMQLSRPKMPKHHKPAKVKQE
jgi:hypothetical protein